MAMFQPEADVSISDPESSSEDGELEFPSHAHDPNAAEDDRNSEMEMLEAFEQLAIDQEFPTNPRAGNDHGLGNVLDLDADGHATVMTSALLEFYCMSRAAEILNQQPGSHGQYTRDSPEARFLGKKMYQYQSQLLSAHGVVAGGIDGEDWGLTRQYYRDSLDILGRAALEGVDMQIAPPSAQEGAPDSATKQVVATSKQLGAITETEKPQQETWHLQKLQQDSSSRQELNGHVVALNSLLQPPSTPMNTPSPVSIIQGPTTSVVSQPSRYMMEFSEIKVLGRGSFGQVFEVRNHVDGQKYAVKKIPVSRRRLEMLQQDGGQHLEHIMKEIRTLARLEHHNVVRYYSAWIEHTYSVSDQPSERKSDAIDSEKEATSGSIEDPIDEEQSFGIVFENSDDNVVIFEDDSKSMVSSGSISQRVEQKPRGRHSRDSHFSSSYRSKRSWNISGADEDDDVESIQRNFSIPDPAPLSRGLTSTWGTDGDVFTDGLTEDPSKLQVQLHKGSHPPAVVLHIQMSLHPLTLSTFLSPRPPSFRVDPDRPPSPRHCFHLLPSLELMLGILAGIEYVHSQRIVHRDLKPANIFLSPQDDPVLTCKACNCESKTAYRPRIGDFGLVADITRDSEPSASRAVVVQDNPQQKRHVGTEFYCPPRSAASDYSVDEKLDIYALGVILFELLYKFDTKMERQLVLFDLTRNADGIKLPADFISKVDCGRVAVDERLCIADLLATSIKGMLDVDARRRWTCKDVRKHLEHVVSVVEGVVKWDI